MRNLAELSLVEATLRWPESIALLLVSKGLVCLMIRLINQRVKYLLGVVQEAPVEASLSFKVFISVLLNVLLDDLLWQVSTLPDVDLRAL